MLKTFVINLATSVERRERVESRLNELGVEFKFFEAVDGTEKPHPLFTRYNDKKRVFYRRKKLSGGELGCYASHYLLWEECVRRNEPILILEDDADISDNFVEAAEIAADLLAEVGYIRLAGTYLKKRPYIPVSKIGDFTLTAHVIGPAGTICYAITPSVAQNFLDYSTEWYLAVDDFMDRYWYHKELCFSLMPFPVGFFTGNSTISRHSNDKKIKAVVFRELFCRIERIRRYMERSRLKRESERLKKLFDQ